MRRGERDCNILPGFAGVWVPFDQGHCWYHCAGLHHCMQERKSLQRFHSWLRLVVWFPALPVRSSHVTAVGVPSPLSVVGYFSRYLQRENAAKTKDSRGVKPRYYGEALTHDDVIQRMEEEEQQKGKRKPAREERGMRKPQQFKYRVKSM